jgi:hypothetical protein
MKLVWSLIYLGFQMSHTVGQMSQWLVHAQHLKARTHLFKTLSAERGRKKQGSNTEERWLKMRPGECSLTNCCFMLLLVLVLTFWVRIRHCTIPPMALVTCLHVLILLHLPQPWIVHILVEKTFKTYSQPKLTIQIVLLTSSGNSVSGGRSENWTLGTCCNVERFCRSFTLQHKSS